MCIEPMTICAIRIAGVMVKVFCERLMSATLSSPR